MIVFLVVVMFFKGTIYNGRRYYVCSSKEDAVKKMTSIIVEESEQLLEGESMDLEIIRKEEGDEKEYILYKGYLSRDEDLLDTISV